MSLCQSFYVKPAAHEIVDTTVALAPDQRPALTGSVVDANERPVSAALVTLYQANAPAHPVGALYTDELGRFAFGPLEAGQLYHIRIFKQTENIRALEQNG